MEILAFSGSSSGIGTTTCALLTAVDLCCRKNKKCLVIQPEPNNNLLLEYLIPLSRELMRVYRESSLSSLYRAIKSGSVSTIEDVKRKIIDFLPSNALGIIEQDKVLSDASFVQDTKLYFKKFVELVQGEYDYLICDLGSARTEITSFVSQEATKVITVLPHSNLRIKQFFKFHSGDQIEGHFYLINKYDGEKKGTTLTTLIHNNKQLNRSNTGFVGFNQTVEMMCDRSMMLNFLMRKETSNTLLQNKVMSTFLSLINVKKYDKLFIATVQNFVDTVTKERR